MDPSAKVCIYMCKKERRCLRKYKLQFKMGTCVELPALSVTTLSFLNSSLSRL